MPEVIYIYILIIWKLSICDNLRINFNTNLSIVLETLLLIRSSLGKCC